MFLVTLNSLRPSSAGRVADLRTGCHWFDPWLGQYSARTHSSLTAVLCFDNGYVGKQPVAWKEYCVEYWYEEFQESMNRCTGCCNITELLLKRALNTIKSIQSSSNSLQYNPDYI